MEPGTDRRKAPPPGREGWLAALRVYVAVVAAASVAWEVLHLPLYTLWTTGTTREQAFAVLHCTAGDVMIAVLALIVSLVIVGEADWPKRSHAPVLLATVAIGVGYTIYSEWMNVVVRQSWAYSPLMPVVPLIGTGLSPLLQWIVIPTAALHVARRATAPRPASPSSSPRAPARTPSPGCD